MTSVGMHEAKTHLSDLIRRVEAGEEVVIRRGTRSVARLVAIEQPVVQRFDADAGAFVVPDDFNEPLSDDAWADFE